MSPAVEVKIGRSAEAFLVRPLKEATLRASAAIHDFIERTLGGTQSVVILDLSQCDHLDSTFLGCMLDLFRQFGQAQPSRFKIAAPATRARAILATNRLDRVLEILPDCPPPAGSWTDLPIPEGGGGVSGRHVLECHRRLLELGGPNQAAFQAVVDQLAREVGETRLDLKRKLL